MALTKKQLESFANADRLSIRQILCILRTAFRLYTCVRAAGNDTDKILKCIDTFITDVEGCIKGK